jgi:hypothetical protein
LSNTEIVKQCIFKIASKFFIEKIEELYFDDIDSRGLFYWIEGVEYLNGQF